MISKKVWIYGRTALADEEALKRQERTLLAFSKDEGFQVVGITMETASGNADFSEREGLNEVSEAAKRKAMDFILVTESFRLFRDNSKLLDYQGQLKEWGIGVIVWRDWNRKKNINLGKLVDFYQELLKNYEQEQNGEDYLVKEEL